MLEDKIAAVLEFWFAETGANSPTKSDSQRWFAGGESLDSEIEAKFGHLLEAAIDDWLETPSGALAYVVLHDQFPLNIYRRQAKAFAFEQQAEAATLLALEKGFDRDMGYGERMFLYMPLMHAESLELQDLGVQMFQRLADEAPDSLREAALGTLKFAQEHRETIVKFGRFPFRNEVLGRQSSTAEQAYLDAGAPRYGQ